MNTKRVKMTHAYGQTPQNVFNDFDWVRQNRKDLLQKYGECFIIVYKQAVIGTGTTYDEAVLDAENRLSSDVGEVTPIHAMLRQRHPFLKVRPKMTEKLESL
ncbi:MAG: hypothetical protein H7Y09_10040 [Chitinophagaceae bacterium]|nr:hypothetical protein [Anaerolineae bacterium]